MRLKISIILIFSLLSFTIYSAEAEIKMLPTLDVVNEFSTIQTREDLITFIKSDNVQKEFIKRGVDPKEALIRIASLTNEEMKSLSDQIKKSQAGGDFGVGTIVGAAVFIFIVLLITDILGLTKVFSFTRSIRS